MIKAAREKGTVHKVIWCITPIYMALIYAYFLFDANAFFLQGTVKGELFPVWILFYYLGFTYKMNLDVLDRMSKKVCWALIAVAFVLEYVETFVIVHFRLGSGFAGSQFKGSSFVFAFWVCL